MDTPDPQEIVDITGPPGETVFFRALAWAVAESGADLRAALDADLRHVADLADDRLLVLLGAMIVEEALDGVLSAIMPGFDKLRETRDVSFSVRTEILRALRLIPDRILASADVVRACRNEVAHKLEVKSFADFKRGRVDALRSKLREFNPAFEVGKSDADAFRELVSLTTGALRVYARHVDGLSAYIRSHAGARAVAAFHRGAVE